MRQLSMQPVCFLTMKLWGVMNNIYQYKFSSYQTVALKSERASKLYTTMSYETCIMAACLPYDTHAEKV